MAKQNKPDDLVIQEAIEAIAKKADIEIDRIDLGCTLMHAMNQNQKQDLVAMMGFLVGQKMEAGEILYNLYHDLNGFKRIYLTGIEDGWLARSNGYAKKVS